MAVASFQPAAAVFREEQNFDWRVYLLVALVEAAVVSTLVWLEGRLQHPPGTLGHLRAAALAVVAATGLSLPLLIVIGFLRMTTEVSPTDLCVWFGWIPTYRRIIALEHVQKVEIIQYRPIRDYGGWGIRLGVNGDRALCARGDRAVRLEFRDGTRLLIGSQRPEELALAIDGVLRPGG